MSYTLLRSTAIHTTKPAETLKKKFGAVTIFANVFPDLELFGFGTFRKKGLKFSEAPASR
jgi:hypothetical protein